ncbi:hypothetical protein GW915_07180 [bacterium]|nr:hypothetical protein [bacterium]
MLNAIRLILIFCLVACSSNPLLKQSSEVTEASVQGTQILLGFKSDSDDELYCSLKLQAKTAVGGVNFPVSFDGSNYALLTVEEGEYKLSEVECKKDRTEVSSMFYLRLPKFKFAKLEKDKVNYLGYFNYGVGDENSDGKLTYSINKKYGDDYRFLKAAANSLSSKAKELWDPYNSKAIVFGKSVTLESSYPPVETQ